jgi:hypothetical protein
LDVVASRARTGRAAAERVGSLIRLDIGPAHEPAERVGVGVGIGVEQIRPG